MPNNQAFIHIDCSLRPSRYRLVTWALLSVMLAVVIGLLALPVSYKIGLWLLLAVCGVVSQLGSQQLLAISSLPSSRKSLANDYLLSELDWQIQCVQGYFVTPYGQVSDIYQAKLLAVSDIGAVMVIKFAVYEPFNKVLTILIWQDQVDSDTWRQLKVIAHQ